MRFRAILFAGLTVCLATGCSTPRHKEDKLLPEIGKSFVQLTSPFIDIYLLRAGAIDLLYCSASFRAANNRWPYDYEELLRYVQQSNGYLALGKYKEVRLKHLPNDMLEVRYISMSHTNEMRFTLGDILSK